MSFYTRSRFHLEHMTKADFDEGAHPRDEKGRFASGGGSSSSESDLKDGDKIAETPAPKPTAEKNKSPALGPDGGRLSGRGFNVDRNGVDEHDRRSSALDVLHENKDTLERMSLKVRGRVTALSAKLNNYGKPGNGSLTGKEWEELKGLSKKVGQASLR